VDDAPNAGRRVSSAAERFRAQHDIPHPACRIPHAEETGPLPAQVLREVVRHAELGYPDEVCGLIIGEAGAPETYVVRAVRNVANLERPADATGTPRDARTAYLMDPREQLAVLRETDERGWAVVAIYHSHPDHDAYFSPMDRERALDQSGRPLWPGVDYLVISVRDGRALEGRLFAWEERGSAFVERAVGPPGPA
jgi:proteasome lid subunit RPN8/RPN11